MYVRFPELKNILGFSWSRQHLIVLCKEGKFPKPYQLSPNRVGWDVDEILAWKASRERAAAKASGPRRRGRPPKQAPPPDKPKLRVMIDDE
jgi:predicted DNA-binding transcriptional regulator AlpA